MVLGQLFQAGEEDLVLDLVADIFFKAFFDQLARRLAGTEARHGGITDQFRELLVQPGVDVAAVHGYGDVLLARSRIAHVHRLLEFGRLFVGFSFGRGDSGALAFGDWFFRPCFVSHGFPLSVSMQPTLRPLARGCAVDLCCREGMGSVPGLYVF